MTEPKGAGLSGRIELVGAEPAEGRPSLAVHAVAADGKIVATAKVAADGRFHLPARVQETAARILIGDASADPTAEGERFLGYHIEEATVLFAGDVLQIAEERWRHLYWATQCVSGTVRRCFPWLSLVDHLVARSSVATIGPSHVDLSLVDPLRISLPFRCATVCQGVVEVYRHRCCCYPPIIVDPGDIFEPPVRWPPIPWPDPNPFPFPEPEPGPFPVPHGPGPDPAPFEHLDRVATSGALDVRKLNQEHDQFAMQNLKGDRLQEYVAARSYLWCQCGGGTKVAEGLISDDGSFSVCWPEFPTISIGQCSDEYAYKVKQSIDGRSVTIYDGPAAGQWFSASDNPTLTSYSSVAVSCTGDPVIPGADGAIVLLHEIGATESHRLGSPAQDSPDSVQTPTWNSGLIDPAATDGPSVNRNLGGTLGLRYFFSHGMKVLGARFFRVEVAAADAVGDPVGSWAAVPVPAWTAWKWTGAGWIRAQHSLGPDPSGLYVIPFQDVNLLAPLEEWDPDQFHALLDTAQRPAGKYLVRIEVFDGAGNQIKPTGATGPGTARAFTFGRWRIPAGPPDPVPYSALTHFLWWDNRPAQASIDAIRLNGSASSAVCQFLEGPSGALVSLDYRAYHPSVGAPLFLRGHSLSIRKGLNGPTTTLVANAFAEVGEPPASAQTSPAVTLATLLAGNTKCAFAATLSAGVKTTNGSGTLTNLDAEVVAAFAAEIV
jgi:hypothetical protein